MPAPNKNFFRKANMANRAQAATLRQIRNVAAGAGTDALNQIYASLGSTGRSASAMLSADQARRVQALGRIGRRAGNQAQATVATARTGNTTRYGAAMGQLSGQQLKPAKAAAGQVAGTGQAGISAGRGLAAAGNQALEIQRAGNKASRSSADYAMASALQYRAKNDAALIAEQHTRIAEDKLQYQQQQALAEAAAQRAHDEWISQQEYMQAKLDKAALSGLGQVTSMLPGVGVTMEGYASGLTEAPMTVDPNTGEPTDTPAWTGKPTAVQLANAAAAAAGITDPADPRYGLLLQVAQLVSTGMPAVDATAQVMRTNYGSLAGYPAQSIEDTLRAGFKAGWGSFTPTGGEVGSYSEPVDNHMNWQGRPDPGYHIENGVAVKN